MSNRRPSAASRLSLTLLEPHRAPELGTSLPSIGPPERGGAVVAVVLGAGRVVVGVGRVVVVAGRVVDAVVVVGVLEVTSVDPGSWNHESVANLPNLSTEAFEDPIRQSQPPEDSAYTSAFTFGIDACRVRVAFWNQRPFRRGSAGSSELPVRLIISGLPLDEPHGQKKRKMWP